MGYRTVENLQVRIQPGEHHSEHLLQTIQTDNQGLVDKVFKKKIQPKKPPPP